MNSHTGLQNPDVFCFCFFGFHSVISVLSLAEKYKDGKNKKRFFPSAGSSRFSAGKPVRKALIAGSRPEGLTVYLAAFAAAQGFEVLVADGANAFDPYRRFQVCAERRPPAGGTFKENLVARAFTCHQLATLDPGAPGDPWSSGKSFFAGRSSWALHLFSMRTCPAKRRRCFFGRCWPGAGDEPEGSFLPMSQSFSGFNKNRSFLLQELVRFGRRGLEAEILGGYAPGGPGQTAPGPAQAVGGV